MVAPSPPQGASLRALIDGVALPPEEARALWARFSQHMDEHRGDFAGFAKAEGLVSAQVAVEQGQPTLHLSSSEQPAVPAKGSRQQAKRGGRSGRGGRRRGRRNKRKR